MTRRFIRDYQLTVGIGSRAVIIRPPIKMAFSATKSTDTDLNKMICKVWGLKPSNRIALVRDEEDDGYLPVELSVGYQGKLQRVFRGSLNTGDYDREGADFVNTLECLDGGVDALNSFTSVTIRGNRSDAIRAALGDMPNTGEGVITRHDPISRPVVLVGNSARIISDLLDDNESMFIDNEQLFVLRDNEVRDGFAPLVSAETGLIGIPKKQKGEVIFQTIINPTLAIAGLCMLKSKQNPDVNGIYIVNRMDYSGDSDGSDWMCIVRSKLAQNYKVVR